MQKLTAKVLSVHTGCNEDKTKPDVPSIQVELDGVVGDKHRSLSRTTWAGDKQPKGTVRRNERQWSAVSREELREIAEGDGFERTVVTFDPWCKLVSAGS